MDGGQASLDQLLEHLLIENSSVHRGPVDIAVHQSLEVWGLCDQQQGRGEENCSRVITLQQSIAENGEDEEALLLRGEDQETCHHEIHRLTVSECRIVEGVGRENSSHRIDSCRRLKSSIFRETTVQILLYIVRTRATPSLVLLEQACIKPGILESKKQCTARLLPYFASKPIRQSNLNETIESRIPNQRQVASMLCSLMERCIRYVLAEKKVEGKTRTEKVLLPQLHLALFSQSNCVPQSDQYTCHIRCFDRSIPIRTCGHRLES